MAVSQRRSRLGAAGRAAFYPARVAARASRAPLEAAADDHLFPELGRLAERALAGPLPEDLARLVVEQRVLERMLAELTATGELDAALEGALASPAAQELVDRIAGSQELRNAIGHIVAEQSAGLFDDLLTEVRGWAARADDTVGRAPAAGSPWAGAVTRSLAFGIDALLIIAAFAVVSGFVALVAALAGLGFRAGWAADLGAGLGWAVVSGGYLTVFWSAAGRTPGMHLFHLRVRRADGRPVSIGRAVVRVIATWVAIVPCFAGYLPVLFDRRRRGLPDVVAGTEVVHDPPSDLHPG